MNKIIYIILIIIKKNHILIKNSKINYIQKKQILNKKWYNLRLI